MEKFPTVRGPLAKGIQLEENVYVAMQDGVRVAVDVYRPEDGKRYPVVLSMAPYPKEMQLWPPALSHSIEAGNTNFLVPQGYVHVIAQIRGTCMSQGQYNWFDVKLDVDGENEDTSDWVFGGQVFADITYKMTNQWFIGINGKYQFTDDLNLDIQGEDIETNARTDNWRVGAQVGLRF